MLRNSYFFSFILQVALFPCLQFHIGHIGKLCTSDIIVGSNMPNIKASPTSVKENGLDGDKLHLRDPET